MYENFAAKYRPKNLKEVLGQDAVKTTLANSVALKRLAHAYVFYGPRGCGKTTVARILAKTLNCHKPGDGAPCDKCPSCLEIAESQSLDVIEIDAASNTDVEHVRNVIIDQAGLSPSRDMYKIYILDEVHMLSKQAFNALLKTIEEPPGHVVFVMATTEQTKVPLTILSRSQCFRFRPIPEALIAARLKEVALKEKLKASDEALAVIAGAAGGAMRDALTLLDRAASFGKGSIQTEVLNELLGHASADLTANVAAALVKREPAALYAGFEKISKEGYDPLTVLRDLRNLMAETFLYLEGFSKNRTALAGVLDKEFSPAALARLSRKLNAVIEEVKFSDSPSLAAEIALFTLAEAPHDLDGLVRRLEALEGRLAMDAAGAAPAQEPSVKTEAQGLGPPASPRHLDRRLKPPALQSPPLTGVQAAASQPRSAGSRSVQNGTGQYSSSTMPLSGDESPSMPSSALWKKLLSGIAAKKPVLYNILLSARVAFEQNHIWKLSSSNKFEADIIEKAKKELEEIMERVCGRKISFIVEHNVHVCAQVAAEDVLETAAAEIEDAGFTETSQSPHGQLPQALSGSPRPGGDAPNPETKWEDALSSKQAPEEAELRKLLKVFHGKITRIQKIK